MYTYTHIQRYTYIYIIFINLAYKYNMIQIPHKILQFLNFSLI